MPRFPPLARAVQAPIGVAGTSTLNFVATNNASLAVVFPVGSFSAAPVVVATPENYFCHAQISAVTAAGFTIAGRFDTNVTATVTVHWHAVAV